MLAPAILHLFTRDRGKLISN